VHVPPADTIPPVPTLRDGFHGERETGPLLRQPGLIAAVTIAWIVMGAVSWILTYMLSFGDPEGPMTLGRAAARWVYAGLWWLASLLGFWLVDTVTVWNWRQYPRMLFHAIAGALIAVGWSVSGYYINLAIIPGWQPEGVGRMVSTTSMTTWFFYTGLMEIGGGYLVWLWLRESRGWLLGAMGGLLLFLYGVVPTLQPAHFGRVYAAYGGVFVVLSILWGWWVDGVRPDRPEVAGAVLCLVGVGVIMYWPRM